MARLNGLFPEGYSERLGNIICYQWRSKSCVRSMPSQYRDARTRTAAVATGSVQGNGVLCEPHTACATGGIENAEPI